MAIFMVFPTIFMVFPMDFPHFFPIFPRFSQGNPRVFGPLDVRELPRSRWPRPTSRRRRPRPTWWTSWRTPWSRATKLGKKHLEKYGYCLYIYIYILSSKILHQHPGIILFHLDKYIYITNNICLYILYIWWMIYGYLYNI